MNFTSQESHCAQLKLYIQTSQQNDWECCSVSPAFLCLLMHFVIATVDSPGQEEEGGKAGRRGGKKGEGGGGGK